MVAARKYPSPTSTAKLGGVAQALGVSNIEWGQPKSKRLGVGKFASRVAVGKADAGGPAAISYATINPGGSTQLLFVYFVTKDASKERRAEVKALVQSLQRM
jgi:hypothetical protein